MTILNLKNQKGIAFLSSILIGAVVLLLFTNLATVYYLSSREQEISSNRSSAVNLETSDSETSKDIAWKTYNDPRSRFSFQIPQDWAVTDGGIECAGIYGFDTLVLVTFGPCWQNEVGGQKLTFQETFNKFRNDFIGETELTKKVIDTPTGEVIDIPMEIIKYSQTGGDNGISVGLIENGTVALWSYQDIGYALVDGNNTHQTDGIFKKILENIRYSEVKSVDKISNSLKLNEQPQDLSAGEILIEWSEWPVITEFRQLVDYPQLEAKIEAYNELPENKLNQPVLTAEQFASQFKIYKVGKVKQGIYEGRWVIHLY